MSANPANETFTAFVTNAPTSLNPAGGVYPIIQDGITKKISYAAIIGIWSTTIITGVVPIYAATDTDIFIGVDKTIGAATQIVLPPLPQTGRLIVIKDIKGDADVNTITLTGGTVDGVANFPLPFPHDSISLVAVGGTSWAVIGRLVG